MGLAGEVKERGTRDISRVLNRLAPIAGGFGLATWLAHRSLPPGTGVGDPIRVAAATVAHFGFWLFFVFGALILALLVVFASFVLARHYGVDPWRVTRALTPLLWGLAAPAAAMVLDAASFWCTAPPLAALGVGLGGLATARAVSSLRALASPAAATPTGLPFPRDPARLGLAFVAALIPALLLPGWSTPSGDEPHYLLVAHSMWREGDLDVAGNYEARDYSSYHPEPVWPHFKPGKVEGTRYSMHGVGFPVLLLPGYVAGARFGPAAMVGLPRLSLVLLYGAFAWVLFGLVQAVAGRGAAVLGTGATALLAPLLFAPLYLFPEVPAMLLACSGYLGLRAVGGTGQLVSAAVALALLPWLGVKYVPLAIAIAAVSLLHEGPVRRSTRAVVVGVALALSLVGHGVFTWILYGSLSPMAIYLGSPAGGATPPAMGARWGDYVSAWRGGVATAIGFLIDQKEGLLAYGPHFLLAAAGLPWMWRRRRADLVAVFAVVIAYVSPYALSQQLGGQGPPVRPLMAVLWLLALPIGVALAIPGRGHPAFAAARGSLLALAASLTLVCATRPALLPHDYPVKSSRLVQAMSPQGTGWWGWFPQWVNVDEPHWGVAVAWAAAAVFAGVLFIRVGRASAEPLEASLQASPAEGPSEPWEPSDARRLPLEDAGWLAAAVTLVVLCGAVLAQHALVGVTARHRGMEVFPGITAWAERELPVRAWVEPEGMWAGPGRSVRFLLMSDRPLESVEVELRSLVENQVYLSIQGATLEGSASPGTVVVGGMKPGRGWRFAEGYGYHAVLQVSHGAAPADLGPSGDQRHLGVFLRLLDVRR